MDHRSIEQEIQAKGLTAPRVTPDDVENEIASEHYFTAAQGVRIALHDAVGSEEASMLPASLGLLTFCVLTLRNGFTVTGESACASPENFDAELGRKIARQSAVAKVWPLLGFRVRDELARRAAIAAGGKEHLDREVSRARIALAAAGRALELFESRPENNVFASVEEAASALENRLMDKAHDDCEGSHNCGLDVYTQEFIVDGKHYIAKLKCEYNRHDKTYYYVDGHTFTTEPVA
jgi:hypothetical protein